MRPYTLAEPSKGYIGYANRIIPEPMLPPIAQVLAIYLYTKNKNYAFNN